MIQRSNVFLLLCMIVGTIVLGALGTWQVQRLYWKEALIERVNDRIASQAVDLQTLQQQGFDKETQEYQPVTATGIFDHSREVYFFATAKGGAPGWHIHTPFRLDNGSTLIVNRGFVPFENKLPDTRSAGQTGSTITVTGLLRFPLVEKPFGSLDNNLETREFYWRNVAEMSKVMQLGENVLPVILDAGDAPNPGGWPKGGTTIVSFTNNHLQYAVTWYGLALTLLGVGGYFLFTRRQVKHD